MDIRDIGSVVPCQFIAPSQLLGWPSLRSLRVRKALHLDAHPEKEVTVNSLSPFKTTIRARPDRFILDFEDSRGRYGHLEINEDDGNVLVCHGHATDDMFGDPYFGVLIVGLPGVLLFSPILLLNGAFMKVFRLAFGASPEAWWIWRNLRGQLMSEDRELVRTAIGKMFP